MINLKPNTVIQTRIVISGEDMYKEYSMGYARGKKFYKTASITRAEYEEVRDQLNPHPINKENKVECTYEYPGKIWQESRRK